MKKFRWMLLTLLFLAVVLGLAYKYINYRKALFPYEAKQDYEYGKIGVDTTIKVQIRDATFMLPIPLDTSYSVFLKTRLETTFLGQWFSPTLDIETKTLSTTEQYEDGTLGFRYLNLTPFLNASQDTFSLKGRFLRVPDQECDLIYFKNTDLSSKRILVIATHPDDAEIAAYGLYSSYPKNTFVLNIKSGESGPFKYDEVYTDTVQHYLKKGQLRTWNSVTIPLLGGIAPGNTLNLGYFSDLKKMYDQKPTHLPSSFTKKWDIQLYRNQNLNPLKDSLVPGSNWSSLVENIIIVLKHVQPDVIVSPYPALDSHMEHKLTTIALFEALKEIGMQKGELLLYSNHYVYNEHYPYGKTGNNMPLPPNFTNTIYFDKIFSHTLSPQKQRDKLFALEAMHDLRPDTEWRIGKKATLKALNDWKTEILGGRGDNTYFVRSIRTSELFFTLPIIQIYDSDKENRILYGNNK